MSRALQYQLSIIALILCLAPFSTSITCPISTCMPSDPHLPSAWLNSSLSAAFISGFTVTIYPFDNNGKIIEDVSGTLELYEVIEMQPAPAPNNPCYHIQEASVAHASGRLALALDMSMLCCELTTFEDTISNGIPRRNVIMTATNPDWPSNFTLRASVSMVDQNVQIPVQPSEYVPFDWAYNYFAGGIKMSAQIINWPWITDQEPQLDYGDTFLAIFFNLSFAIPSGSVGAFNVDWPLATYSEVLFSATSDISNTLMEFLRVYDIDGIPHTSILNSSPNITDVPLETNLRTPISLSVCQDYQPIVPRYSNFSYDPSLVSLFAPPPPPPGTPPASTKSSKLNPAAYAVPIAFVVVAIIVFIIVYLNSPKLRSVMQPFSVREHSKRTI